MNSFSNFQIPDVWEVKDVVTKLKNVVLNFTEMEAKVHEATSNDPWGASTTLMQEIAQGTFNYQYFNEIMPTIYKRFTEKEPRQWRQIYKALTLLEYLIKNGNERVVDDARSHISMIKTLRNFFYVDDKGKDEGINVRNRAKEVAELLSNTELIRSERKNAKKNRNKYTGVGSEGSFNPRSTTATGSPLVANISKIIGGFSGTSTSGGISFNGDAYTFGQDRSANYQAGKYDFDDDFQNDTTTQDDNDQFEEPKTQTKSNDDDWGDFTWGEPVEQSSNTKTTTSNSLFDDDFSDFQEAAPIHSSTKPTQTQDLFDLLDDNSNNSTFVSSAPSQQQQLVQPSIYQFETKPPIAPTNPQQQVKKEEPVSSTPVLNTGMWAQASNFVSLDSLGKSTNNTSSGTGPSMNALKNNSVKADWNQWANSNPKPAKSNTSNFDDLLF